MGNAYQRADVANNISNGNVINADDLDAEFNALESAFNSAAGHSHDGTTGEGGPITVVGPAQDLIVSGTTVLPKTDNTLDLGSTTYEFKDLWIDGTANIDALVADTADINGGTIDGAVIGGTTPAAITGTTINGTTGNFTTVDATNVEVTNIKAKDGTASIVITDATGAVTITGTPIPPSKTLVSEDGTQTLTNKTINLTNNTLVATSAQLRTAVTDETGTGALVFADSPALAGTPTAPTAAAATNTTQIATTAHVFAERTNTATLTNKTLTSPVITGGTLNGGAALTVDSTELNILDGATLSTAELNTLDGITATTVQGGINAAAQGTGDRIINGAFDIWQRGTSGTANNYTAADRWKNYAVGGTVTQSRQDHPVGTKFGRNTALYFLRQTVSGQSLASHAAATSQLIEDVRSYAGETITVMGWAKRSSGSGNMAVEVEQAFGTGGSPSAIVRLAPVSITLTGSWEPFVAVFALPSITGKTLGSNGDDFVSVNFWTSAGSDFNSRTGSLGIQTIGVDLWGIHIRIGTFATADVTDYIAPQVGDTFARCLRYYETGSGTLLGYHAAGGGSAYNVQFKAIKRRTPTLGWTPTAATNVTTYDFRDPSPTGANWFCTATATGGFIWNGSWTASAEL